jgi:Transposase
MATARTLESAFFSRWHWPQRHDLLAAESERRRQPSEIHVAIETPHGPIVEALLERGFSVYSINAKQLDRFRDRFTVSGAKDDSLDSYVLADSLRTNIPLFR